MKFKHVCMLFLVGTIFTAASYQAYSSEEVPLQKEPASTTIKLVSVGDIMMHEEQIASGYQSKTGTYDYHSIFEPVKKYLQDGDLAIGNLELTLAGKDKGYSGYPQFNAPDEIAYALKDSGFDILTTANNHSIDRGFYGVKRTIQVLDKVGLAHTGTFKSAEESNNILIKDVKDTRIAFLAYTYGTNGIAMDKGKAFSINKIDKNKIIKDIARARALRAEVICVSVHFGTEYMRQPSSQQKEVINFLISQGADIILGNHPHVLQPVEIRKTKKAGKNQEAVILYSQGNFLSVQRERYQDTSAVFNIELEKNDASGNITIKSVTYIPTWIDLSRIGKQYHFRVLPIQTALKTYTSKKDPLLSSNDYNKLKRSLEDVKQILKNKDKRVYQQIISFKDVKPID